jgi:hypothetical protein
MYSQNGWIENPSGVFTEVTDSSGDINDPLFKSNLYLNGKTGELQARTGYIGGFTIHKDMLQSTHGTTPSISLNGITGKLIANDATIRGHIEAVTGAIGGFNIEEGKLTTTGAGLSGVEGVGKDNPAFWAGGTYAQAIGGTAKSIIRHDGSSKFSDTEITGVINALSGELGSLTMKEGGYIDLPPTYSSQKGRLDNDGLSLIYDGANSQKIEWNTWLGSAGRITCNSQGRLRLSSSFGIELSVDFLDYSPISITGSGFKHSVNFGTAEVSNIRKLSTIGQLNMAYTTHALSSDS